MFCPKHCVSWVSGDGASQTLPVAYLSVLFPLGFALFVPGARLAPRSGLGNAGVGGGVIFGCPYVSDSFGSR